MLIFWFEIRGLNDSRENYFWCECDLAVLAGKGRFYGLIRLFYSFVPHQDVSAFTHPLVSYLTGLYHAALPQTTGQFLTPHCICK